MKHTLRKLLTALVAALFVAVLTAVPGFAAGAPGDIASLDVNVTLLEDGTAQVIELWDVTLEDDWSELYTPKTNLGAMSIRNLQVKDLTEGVEYTYTGTDWDVGEGLDTDTKRQMKYHRCGIVERSDGVELCWGVDGEGDHKYQVSYLLSNMVQKYSDGYDGFHVRFINSDLSSTPDHVSVTIDTQDVEELTGDNTRFWAFGLEGTTKLEDGKIIVESDEGGNIHFVNVMARFDEGIFYPETEREDTFRSVVETAFEDSDYDITAYDDGTSGGNGDTSQYGEGEGAIDNFFSEEFQFGSENGSFSENAFAIAGLFPPLLIFLAVCYVIWRGLNSIRTGGGSGLLKRVNSTITRAEKKEVLYSRELPLGGSLPESYLALDTLNELPGKAAIIEAYLLKWMKNGWARVEEQPEKRLMGLISDKMTPSIVFVPEQKAAAEAEMDTTEAELWRLLHGAAGADEVLQEKELKTYAENHYAQLERFFENVLSDGLEEARRAGDVEDVKRKQLLFTSHSTELSAAGKERFLKLLGFKKFLQDFTIINEREARDVGLWGDYLTYAALFGIADEVAKQFKTLVPDFFEQPETYGYYGAGWSTYDVLYITHMLNRFSNVAYNSYMAGRSAQEIHTSSAGGGGFSSFGGGGGFSGGGVGGGGR